VVIADAINKAAEMNVRNPFKIRVILSSNSTRLVYNYFNDGPALGAHDPDVDSDQDVANAIQRPHPFLINI
jgi:hypothetical protein